MLDINKVVVGETKVHILSLPSGVRQKVGDVGTIVKNGKHADLPLAVNFGENQCGGAKGNAYWWFNPEHLEIVEDSVNEENIVEYNIGDKFRVVNLDGGLTLAKCGVKVGDVGEIIEEYAYGANILLRNENWIGEEGYASEEVHFNKSNIEPFVEKHCKIELITESRWNEIIEEIEGWYGLKDEELNVIKSVLKHNTPYNVVADKIDPIISKDVQTHLDANYIGDNGNPALYYKSEVLKKWFCWNTDNDSWEECEFSYEDDSDLFPITIGETE